MDGLIAYALAKKYADKVGQSILDAGFKVQVEQDRSILNRTGEQMTLYLLPKESSLSSDTYDEYVYTTKWEQVGSTNIELDYNDLVNKPRINGYELTGDKAADQLYLQPVLIAPENGAISLYTLPGISAQQITLKGDIAFLKLNITDYAYANGFQLVAFQADAHSLKVRDAIPIDERGVYFKFVTKSSAASPDNNYEDSFYFSRESGRLFHRYLESNYLSSWSEISLGSQIVSGVVNQNGTITFTDSAGNVVNTTGDKLVTSGNQQISMGYDSDGFYFLFDDGQEVVNNGTN